MKRPTFSFAYTYTYTHTHTNFYFFLLWLCYKQSENEFKLVFVFCARCLCECIKQKKARKRSEPYTINTLGRNNSIVDSWMVLLRNLRTIIIIVDMMIILSVYWKKNLEKSSKKVPFYSVRWLCLWNWPKNRQNCQILLTDIHKKMYQKMKMKSQ